MKVQDIINELIPPQWVESRGGKTVDGLIFGDPQRQVKKIATTLIATPDVIKAAGQWGADLIITHEPTFHNATDIFDENSWLCTAKKTLIEQYDLTIIRYHDAMHWMKTDLVSLDFIQKMGWEGDFDEGVNFISAKPMKIQEIVERVKTNLGLVCPRIVGQTDETVTKIKLNLGKRSSASYKEFVESADWELVIAGELCEWSDAEPIRDAAQLGAKKTLLILGHAGSEKSSMEALAKDISGKFSGAEVRYFDCGELYTY